MASFVDFQPYILAKKIRTLYSNKDLKEVGDVHHDEHEVAYITQQVIEIQPNIKFIPKVLKDLINHQFADTKHFYRVSLITYFIFYFIPLLRQMVET